MDASILFEHKLLNSGSSICITINMLSTKVNYRMECISIFCYRLYNKWKPLKFIKIQIDSVGGKCVDWCRTYSQNWSQKEAGARQALRCFTTKHIILCRVNGKNEIQARINERYNYSVQYCLIVVKHWLPKDVGTYFTNSIQETPLLEWSLGIPFIDFLLRDREHFTYKRNLELFIQHHFNRDERNKSYLEDDFKILNFQRISSVLNKAQKATEQKK